MKNIIKNIYVSIKKYFDTNECINSEDVLKSNNEFLLSIEDLSKSIKIDVGDFIKLTDNGFIQISTLSESMLNTLTFHGYFGSYAKENFKYYIKNYENHKLLIILSGINETQDDYFIASKALLDNNDDLLKSNDSVSMTFFMVVPEYPSYKLSLSLILNFDGDFYKSSVLHSSNYHSFNEVTNYDFTFFTTDFKAVSAGTVLDSNYIKANFRWYIEQKFCYLNMITDIFPHLKDRKLEDLVDYKKALTEDEFNLFMMSII